jgi:SNF2 family DNA or RNA helicase
MLIPSQLYNYQKKAILHQLYNPLSMLWIGCGLGKTIITLSTIEHRMRAGQVQKTLIFGPLRVIYNVWEREARKWMHTQNLTFSIIHGPAKKRLRNLFANVDIYLCNYENMAWLSNQLDHYYISQDKPLPFQQIIYDEITRVKNSNSVRVGGGWKYYNKGQPHETRERLIGWRKIIPHFQYRSGLTGTPAANSYIDLHGQYLCIDNGNRLAPYITHYRDSYFTQAYDGFTYRPTEVGKYWIEHKISDITIKMDAEDYMELPPLKTNDIYINLPDKATKHYKEVEKEMFTRLDNGTEIELFNQASVSNKCLQFANGAPYNRPGELEYTKVHDAKLEALDSIIEEAHGETILIGYNFKSDADRIMKRYRTLRPVNLTKTPVNQFNDVLKKGNAGDIKLMVGHPASLGHGVDGLQDFCKIIVWFGLNWNLELYNQLIDRIAGGVRRTEPVTMHRILAQDTIDLAVMDALNRKESDQAGLKAAIDRYRTRNQLNFM